MHSLMMKIKGSPNRTSLWRTNKMQIILKTKNQYCLATAEKMVKDMERKFSGVLDFHSWWIDSKDHTRGMIVTINGYIDAQVLIGGVDGSYIHIWWMKDGVNQFYDIGLFILTRIVQL